MGESAFVRVRVGESAFVRAKVGESAFVRAKVKEQRKRRERKVEPPKLNSGFRRCSLKIDRKSKVKKEGAKAKQRAESKRETKSEGQNQKEGHDLGGVRALKVKVNGACERNHRYHHMALARLDPARTVAQKS